MKKRLNDEEFDQLLRTLVSDASPADADLAEIVDAPTLWRNIKSNIDDGKNTAFLPWPPAKWLSRGLAVGVPAFAAVVIFLAFFAWRPADNVQNITMTEPSALSQDEPDQLPETSQPAVPTTTGNKAKPAPQRMVTSHVRTKPRLTTKRSTPEAQEMKTEFIALSYARNPDSGQIVRVKVPSSMMVTLGLVQTVEKPTNLVDAEVLVGDDGLTRAIRFIR